MRSPSSFTLRVHPAPLAITRLGPKDAFPAWASEGSFLSITRTEEELSLVCDDARTPQAGLKTERTWRALKVQGPLDFALTGILARLATTLAQAEISIFAISTFDTDYILVKEEQLEAAARCLRAAGHTIVT